MPSSSVNSALGVEGLALGDDLMQAGVAHQHGLGHRLLVEGELVLVQVGDAFPGPDEDLAFVGVELAGQDLQKGRFAGAVGADQAVAVAGGELDVDILEDDSLAVGKSDIGGVYHGECSVKVMSGACFLRWRRSGMVGGTGRLSGRRAPGRSGAGSSRNRPRRSASRRGRSRRPG